MLAQEQIEGLEHIARMLKEAKSSLVLTGAGISTESGIPDFRSPGSGLWQNLDPMTVLTRQALWDKPEKFYFKGFAPFLRYLNAMPNSAHQTVAWLEEQGLITGVITQNIDGLHQKAGSQRVWEIHGNLTQGHCMKCRRRYPIRFIEDALAAEVLPICTECNNLVRPNVTLFGDTMPNDFWQAQVAADRSDFMLIIGSSLEVSPANTLPRRAKRQAIINLTVTASDQEGWLVVTGKAGLLLSTLKQLLQTNCRRN